MTKTNINILKEEKYRNNFTTNLKYIRQYIAKDSITGFAILFNISRMKYFRIESKKNDITLYQASVMVDIINKKYNTNYTLDELIKKKLN